MKSAQLDDASDRIPSIHAFATAAASVTEVTMNCSSLLSAALADSLLSRLPAVREISLSGRFLPAVFPHTVGKMAIGRDPEGEEADWDHCEPDAVLLHADRLPQLHSLVFDFDLSNCVSLTCPLKLRSLKSVSLSLSLYSGTFLGLSWLHQQRVQDLHVKIWIWTPDPAQLSALLLQLTAG